MPTATGEAAAVVESIAQGVFPTTQDQNWNTCRPVELLPRKPLVGEQYSTNVHDMYETAMQQDAAWQRKKNDDLAHARAKLVTRTDLACSGWSRPLFCSL